MSDPGNVSLGYIRSTLRTVGIDKNHIIGRDEETKCGLVARVLRIALAGIAEQCPGPAGHDLGFQCQNPAGQEHGRNHRDKLRNRVPLSIPMRVRPAGQRQMVGLVMCPQCHDAKKAKSADHCCT